MDYRAAVVAPGSDRSRLNRTDLNLLVAFDALMSELSVTRAAERLSIGQPAMSASLGRLRKLFDDPLLVREGGALVPTSTALSLLEPIREALSLVDSALGTRHSFDPATAERMFTIIASDYLVLVMLQDLFADLAESAPGIRLNIAPIVPDFADQLRRGLTDFVILPSDVAAPHTRHLPHEELFRDRYVVAVDRDNPAVGDSIDMATFNSLPYIAYSGGPLQSVAQMRLESGGWQRQIDVTTQSFVVAPFLLTGTRFTALIHERLGARVAETANLHLLEPPEPLEPLTECLYWRPQDTHDPGHRWLRERLRSAAPAPLPTSTINGVDASHH